MKKAIFAPIVLSAFAAQVSAGGIDRSGQSTAVIFEEGRHLEFSYGSVSPDVSGIEIGALGGDSSGDMAPRYALPSFAYKADVNDTLSYAVIYDQPFGAHAQYPTGTGYYFAGSDAQLTSHAITAILKHTTDNNVSIFGGVRAQSMEADISLPAIAYTGTGSRTWDAGFLIGAAWEKPEIAARVALTFSTEISHDLATSETTAGPAFSGSTNITTPSSINLDFQTGIAEDTLLFGSVRYVPWDGFAISPTGFVTVYGGDPIVSFSNDKASYTVGIGRRINENLSLAVTAGYEGASGGISSNLAPTDGNRSIGIGGTYTNGDVSITSGIRYIKIGGTSTEFGAASPAATFAGNSGLALGFKVEMKI